MSKNIESIADTIKMELSRANRARETGYRYNEEFQDVTELEITDRIKPCLDGTEDNGFMLDFVAEVNIENPLSSKRYVIHLYGGKNGSGKWNEYFVDAVSIINKLMDSKIGNFKKAYLIDWHNDCADDVFDLLIGVRE